VDILIRKANEIELNYPDRERGQLGPFIFERQAAIVDEHIDDALAKGAKIQTGGKSQNLGGGLYMRPTVLTDVNHEMKIMRDETFGPVMPIMKYRTEDEAIRLANDTYYGLSAAVIAGSEEEAHRIGNRLDAGNVSIQDTFLTFASFAAGIEPDSFNYSGIGRGRPGMLAFVRKQGVLINTAAPACLASEGIKSV
jgi:succinate-semialdehyde dehydrogenase / glutarate-semialdehyde dehydrogenase